MPVPSTAKPAEITPLRIKGHLFKRTVLTAMLAAVEFSFAMPAQATTAPAPASRTPAPAAGTVSPDAAMPREASMQTAPVNPYLAAASGAITHFDSSQSDAVPYPIARGTYRVDLNKVPHIARGPVTIMTLTSTSPNYMWAVSSRSISYVDVSKGGFQEVAALAPPGRSLPLPEASESFGRMAPRSSDEIAQAFQRTYGDVQGGGAYSFVDNHNEVFFNLPAKIVVFGLVDPANPAGGIKVLRSRDVSSVLAPGETLTGMQLTFDGKLVVVGKQSLSVVDRSLEGDVQRIAFGADEAISNSVCIDENNGIYVATDKIMRKVVWTGTRLSSDPRDGAWEAPYLAGNLPPTIKVSTGTGSTPTLMGFGPNADKLVVITDGVDRMNLLAFWRDEIPAGSHSVPGASPRVAGLIPVRAGLPDTARWIQSEQSVVVWGYGAFVVNNISEKPLMTSTSVGGGLSTMVNVIGVGPVAPPATGVERFEWESSKHAWRAVWARGDISSPSMIPTVSTASGTVIINANTAQDGWDITGLDWNTGKTVTRLVFGKQNVGNGAYAQVQLMPNGDLLFNSLVGPRRVALRK